MGLFVCENCRCVENTSLGRWWTRNDHKMWNDLATRGKALCSECGPTHYSDGTTTKFGKWHGRFTKDLATITDMDQVRNPWAIFTFDEFAAIWSNAKGQWENFGSVWQWASGPPDYICVRVHPSSFDENKWVCRVYTEAGDVDPPVGTTRWTAYKTPFDALRAVMHTIPVIQHD